MRLAVCALSAVMLSGCSWLGGFGGGGQGGSIFGNSSQYSANNGSYRFDQHNPCVIPSPRAPIPRGCNPANVTIGTASGGFPQQPNFGNPQFANAGFGSHAGVAGQQAVNYKPRKRLKKPKYRGSLSLGLEKSISGDILDSQGFAGPIYIPGNFESRVNDTLFTAGPPTFETSDISFNNIHSTPINIKGGVEYIFSPQTTAFANIGYSYSEGESRQGARAFGEIQQIDTTSGDVTSSLPNQNLANFTYDFDDLNRIDLEVGARRYFNPIVRDQGFKTLTPFVGASVGVAYFDDVSFDVTQNQVSFQQSILAGGSTGFFDVPGQNQVELYDSEWVPTGQLNAGVEWQVTPKTALAVESGLRFEGSRDFSNGESGDTNIIIPFTVRGSYNF